MSALHAGHPWRTVVHIDTQKGPRGGEAWVLTLECEHTAFRAMPTIRPEDIVQVRHKGSGKRLRPLVRIAPYRVRCLWCEA